MFRPNRTIPDLRARRRGATALEMAIVAPVVLTLLFGVLDLGIAVYSYNTVAEAVRAGTRYAVVHGARSTDPSGPAANDAAVDRVVRGYAPGFIGSRLSVASSWPDGGNEPSSRVTVSASYEYTPAVTWVIGFRRLRLSSTSTMVITH